MHELDIFMESLIRKNQVLGGLDSSITAVKKYNEIFKEFYLS
jgi:hypothetical protein